ncbi:metallophosphoesterase [Enterococcus songbeiensis]
MKKWIVPTIGFLLLLVAFGTFLSSHGEKKASWLKKEAPDFWVLSDVHFIAPELHDDGPEFTYITKTAAGKDLYYQEESLQAFIEKARQEKPEGIIITGDLTLNGEKASAEKMADLFRPLEKKGIKLLCIPGNHDIHDGWARSYHGEEQEKIPQISPEDFKKIFPDGYELASSTDPDSLSYSISVNSHYQFIFLDSNIYTLDVSSSAPPTGGELSKETLSWLKQQLTQAKKAKQTSLVFMHHNLYQHNALVHQGYVLKNTNDLKKLLKDYKVPVVFSGHIHVQDIMADPDQQLDTKEIVTGSFAIADHGYGILSIQPQKITYNRKTLDVDTWAKEQHETAENLLHHQKYLKDLFLLDGERMAYEQLLGQDIFDKTVLEPSATFVGEKNYLYFTGNDFLSDTEVAQEKQQEGYQLIAEHSSFLKNYLDTILQDTNLPDDHLEISLSEK